MSVAIRGEPNSTGIVGLDTKMGRKLESRAAKTVVILLGANYIILTTTLSGDLAASAHLRLQDASRERDASISKREETDTIWFRGRKIDG